MDNRVKEIVCSYENLYKAMQKCRNNVGWKDSVINFTNEGITNCAKLREQLLNDKYKILQYSIFYVYEPKKRKIVSTRFKDRVFQRSLCDNYFTQKISKSFIYDNCACQINKGTKFARDRLKCHLQKYYRKHGTNGYVLKCDVADYFGSTSHEVAFNAVKKRVEDEWVLYHIKKIIDSFNDGVNPNVGMGLGSQVTQLIQLAVLDDLDHYIKEGLHIKQYIRYMDDFILIHEDKEYLLRCKEQIRNELAKIGLQLSKKKTQLFPITHPIKFLGFSFRLTQGGRVVMKLLPKKISHERRKLKKQVNRAKNGIMTREQVDNCFKSWEAHAKQGHTYRLRKHMKRYYKNLWR